MKEMVKLTGEILVARQEEDSDFEDNDELENEDDEDILIKEGDQ